MQVQVLPLEQNESIQINKVKLKTMKYFLLGFGLLCLVTTGYSQEMAPYRLTLEQAIEMGLQNHQQLRISQARLQVSEDQVKAAKTQQLPSVTFSANAFYLGDALILDKDWSKVQTVDMPHFGNTFGIQASQLLYKGGVIKHSIEMAELQQQLAGLDLVTNEQEIKFLIISHYLDIYKIMNQIQVFEQNKVLAEQLLENIRKSFQEDMVTRNEVIRAELQIKNIDQAILTMKNNHAILSYQMSYALGLPNNITIIPAEIIPTEDANIDIIIQSQDYYSDMAKRNHPVVRSAEKSVEIAEKNVDIQQSDWFPAITAFGGYNMQRPLTSNTPIMDMYNNSWQVGVSLSFDIDNLFKTKRQVNLSRSQVRTSREALTYARQNIEIGVNAAYRKYKEAEQQVLLMDESRKLANENYEIVRNKYLNQLAITAEMTDASNAKLNADLEYANAVINTVFQYYSLLKTTGNI